MINSDQILTPTVPPGAEPPCTDCVHPFDHHHDLTGCAIPGCSCTESKATLIEALEDQ